MRSDTRETPVPGMTLGKNISGHGKSGENSLYKRQIYGILNLLRASLASGTTGPVIVTYTPYSFLSFRYSCRGPCCPQNLYSGGISVARCFLYCYVQSRPVQTWNILVDSSSGIKEQLSIVEIHHFAHSRQKAYIFCAVPLPIRLFFLRVPALGSSNCQ